ncbi:GNAT family N-acetyltransferase [Alkalicoccus urumqiensis]|uniref:Aminoglycoside N(3)-acetyltransferase n=1 Tax=Alkalicoccus urumqiensis TaxID=1548213 RepID=A0A2P6MLE3_ALKUR|nr:GNAT family N-acetyltransferase [Alkalicoccus urumqiensis]PRO67095.1 hypothetical protein C6I21_00565 [Alkalicoccus urumqiensis]
MIRRAGPEDAKTVKELVDHVETHAAYMLAGPGERDHTEEDVRHMLGGPHTNWFLAEEMGTAAGYAVMFTNGMKRKKHVASIVMGVAPAYQRRGWGRALLREVECAARTMGLGKLELTVAVPNKGAYALYEQAGYRIEGTKAASLLIDGSPVDEYMMSRKLEETGAEAVMKQQAVSENTALNTVDSIVRGLEELGVRQGDALLVHSSLSAFGWVNGGAAAVIDALQEAVGPSGTIVMPAQSGDWSDPKNWGAPAVPSAWWEEIRRTMPLYDPEKTPTRGMGTIAELFRTYPGVHRSLHPADSFAAWGKEASWVLETHQPGDSFGETSPLGRLEQLDADILFLGTGYDTATGFHLAEARLSEVETETRGAPMMKDGVRTWVEYEDKAYDSSPFAACGQAYEEAHQVRKVTIGDAACRRFPLKSSVVFAGEWLRKHLE